MPIRVLPQTVVNRIAAGEVVERPASVVKELVENALDAGATRIEIVLADGGRGLIAVSDDGHGMDADALALAVERHATSKLPDDDLVRIGFLGFRGEALPAIGSVARLTITSRAAGAREASAITVEAGRKEPVRPASRTSGTRVEVRDLFYATPARLKFLKQIRTEESHALEIVRRLALAYPAVAFRLTADDRTLLRVEGETADLLASERSRLGAVLGREVADNTIAIAAERDGFRLGGFAGLPTLNRATGQHHYLFVNRRPVQDRMLAGAVRAAYQDFLARDRHPVVVLFVDAPPELVDVNVHPAKTEVRFRDAGLVRGLIVGGLRHALAEAGHRAATTVAAGALGAFRPAVLPPSSPPSWRPAPAPR
ncbi:MAG: DNA mismatch repair endonuclease MutL, partial [Alphaproteobacteria bacterium]|nr:DNA mismatch repair endonuclease MutL [Alphaproteobacteria bacterium]